MSESAAKAIPRVRQIGEALVRHFHAFVRELRPTQEEGRYGIDFLTRIDQMWDDNRQEFILLSDTLGGSMLVATETTVLGPFFVQPALEKQNGANISDGMDGDSMLVTGSVSRVDGYPLAGAMVDVWHSDDDGSSDVQQLDRIGNLAMRARFNTEADGRFHFWSIKLRPILSPTMDRLGEMLEAQGRHPWRSPPCFS